MLPALLLPVLRDGASPQVQQLAHHVATSGNRPHQGLLLALARMPHLDGQLRRQLQRDVDPEVRATVFRRQDTPGEEVVWALQNERTQSVLNSAVGAVQDVDPVVTELRRRLTKPLGVAIVTMRRWDLPADVICAAIKAARHIDAVTRYPISTSKADLSELVEDASVDPLTRLAAAVSSGTSSQTVVTHLSALVEAASGNGEVSDMLKQLAQRAPDPDIAAVVETSLTHLPTDLQNNLRTAFAHWSGGHGESGQHVLEWLDAATDPTTVTALWESLSTTQQSHLLANFAAHPLCSPAIFKAAQAAKVLDGIRVIEDPPLAVVQDEELFKDLVGRRPLHLGRTCLALAQKYSRWAQPASTLLGWMLDEMIADDDASNAKAPSTHKAWGWLLAHPDFPRHRLDEVPAYAIRWTVPMNDRNHDWIVQTLREAFAALPAGTALEAKALLDAVVSDFTPLTGTLRASMYSLTPDA